VTPEVDRTIREEVGRQFTLAARYRKSLLIARVMVVLQTLLIVMLTYLNERLRRELPKHLEEVLRVCAAAVEATK
jgi:hypothetical protein